MVQVLQKLARYQSIIKTMGAVALVLLATALVGLGVEFLYTLPLLIFVPLIAQLWCKRPIPLLIAGYAGITLFAFLGTYNEQNCLHLAIFSIISLTFGIACGLAVTWIQATIKPTTARPTTTKPATTKRALLLGLVACLLAAGSFISCRFTGSPLTYVRTLTTVRSYMRKTYSNRPEVTFSFEGVQVDRAAFWRQYADAPSVKYSAEWENTGVPPKDVKITVSKIKEIPNGIKSFPDTNPWYFTASAKGYHESIDDGYVVNVLGPTFDDEQGKRLSPYVLAAVDFVPTQIFCYSALDLASQSLLREEYLDYYAAWKPLTPEQAQKKLTFENSVELNISWNVSSTETREFRADNATYSDDSQYLTKDEFIKRATAIHAMFAQHQPPYAEVVMSAGLTGAEASHTHQILSFTRGDSLETMLDGYTTSGFDTAEGS
jgi:hypothetical protein